MGSDLDADALMRNPITIPTVAGTKYTGSNMYQFQHIVGMKQEGWTVFSDMDEQCAFAAMVGSSINIGSTLNVMPGVYRKIHDSCRAGDFSRACELQLQANRVTAILSKNGFPGALRAVLGLLDFPSSTS
jgi:dihydrodipicolinate synthase/N-acetylneuraminate lyase